MMEKFNMSLTGVLSLEVPEELLIERIQRIQKELPPAEPHAAEEEAFLEAAEEQLSAWRDMRMNPRNRRFR